MGGVHHGAQHAGAVLHAGAPARVGQHQQDGGGPVVGVALHAPGQLVQLHHRLAVLGALHRHDHRGLHPHAGGGVGARLQHGVQRLGRYLVGLVGPHAAAGL